MTVQLWEFAMGLFDSVIGAVSGQLQQQGGLTSLWVVCWPITASWWLGRLAEKFNQAGLGDVVSPDGKGENPADFG
jgi:hypothetical protein